MIIPQISRNYQKTKCICNDSKACGQISLSFQGLHDLRGSFIQFPMTGGYDRLKIQNALRIKKAERFCFYLKIPFESSERNKDVSVILDTVNQKHNTQEDSERNGGAALTMNNANQKDITKDDNNCASGINITRKKVYVALHHFHPWIIDPKFGVAKVHCHGTRYRLPDLVQIEHLEHLGLMEYCSSNDVYDKTSSIIVPNYSIFRAAEDLSRICVTIERVPPMNSDSPPNISLPLSKRSKEQEVAVQNKRTKITTYDKDTGIELKTMNMIMSDVQGSLRRINSRVNAMNIFYSDLCQSYQSNTLSDQRTQATDLSIMNDITAECLFEVHLINNLQNRLSCMQTNYFSNTAFSSTWNNQSFESAADLATVDTLTTGSLSHTPSIDSLYAQLSSLEGGLIQDIVTLDTKD